MEAKENETEGFTEQVIVKCNCGNCKHHSSKKDSYEDGNDYDWWYDHYCSHPSVLYGDKTKRYIAENDRTPDWCPFIQVKTVI